MLPLEQYREILKSLNKQAIALLLKKKIFKAHAFLVGATAATELPDIIMVPFNAEQEGQDIRGFVKRYRPEAVVTITEGFTGPQEGGIQPEALILSAEHVKHGQYLVMNTMSRKGKRLKVSNEFDTYQLLAEAGNNVSVGGSLAHLLSDEPTEAKVSNINRHPGYRAHFKSKNYTVH